MSIASGPAFLLGAGASKDAGLPLSSELTDRVLEQLRVGRFSRDQAQAFNYVVAVIMAHDAGLRSGLVTDRPDIERVASAIELLGTRQELEVTPFVGAWDGAISGFEKRAAGPIPGIDRKVRDAFGLPRSRGGTPQTPNTSALVDVISTVIDSKTERRQHTFQQLLSAVVECLPGLLTAEAPACFDYLAPILRAHEDGKPPTIATLNYDLGIETAARGQGLEVTRGIEWWSRTGEVKFAPGKPRLLKLHGSIDWYRLLDRTGLRASGLTTDEDGRSPLLVFGQREKLRAVGPFLQLLEAFRASLRRTDTLIVIGYGFRDPHINEVVGGWLLGSEHRRVAVVDPFYEPGGPVWGREPDYRWYLNRWRSIEANRSRVAWVREGATDFLGRYGDDDQATFIDALFNTDGSPEGEVAEV